MSARADGRPAREQGAKPFLPGCTGPHEEVCSAPQSTSPRASIFLLHSLTDAAV